MSNHYYSKNPDVASQQKKWQYTLKNHLFSFMSDNGVFSKNTVDFGSRLLVESFDVPEQLHCAPILDVGCGYGPIGLTYAKTYPTSMVEMVDVNERAIELAHLNAKQNGISNVVIHQSNVYETLEHNQYGVIVSNPPIRAGKQVVHAIIEESYPLLMQQGCLVIVIQKKQGAPSAEKKMLEVFGNCELIARDKGYWILQSIKEENHES